MILAEELLCGFVLFRNPQNREEAGRLFRDASEAYQTLSDASKRAQYDASLHDSSFRRANVRPEYSDPFASSGGSRRGVLLSVSAL